MFYRRTMRTGEDWNHENITCKRTGSLFVAVGNDERLHLLDGRLRYLHRFGDIVYNKIVAVTLTENEPNV